MKVFFILELSAYMNFSVSESVKKLRGNLKIVHQIIRSVFSSIKPVLRWNKDKSDIVRLPFFTLCFCLFRQIGSIHPKKRYINFEIYSFVIISAGNTLCNEGARV